MTYKVFREERLQRIIERIQAARKVYVEELAAEFNLSPASIRLDLAELERRRMVKRTHGGAIALGKMDGHVITQKSPFDLRMDMNRAEKNNIGLAAANLINDGDTLMIDGGSTTFCVAHHLVGKRGLTIITNSISLLPELYPLREAQIYLTGGLVEPSHATLGGEITLDILSRFRTVKTVLGIDGISLKNGLSAITPSVAAVKRKMIAASQQLIVVADNSKFDQVCLVPLATIEEMNVLITDSHVPEYMIAEIRSAGPQVIVVPME